MNDSPGRPTPGPSPSDGERPSAGSEGQNTAGAAGADRPAGAQKWSAEQPPPAQWQSPGAPQPPAQPAPPGPAPVPPQQPAPGGWGSYGSGPGGPGQPGGPGGPAPYGYPGGPGAPWGKPPAAKPGVIPLRPLDLGEILDGAVATMRGHWRSVLPITLVVSTVIGVLGVLVQKYTVPDLQVAADPQSDPAEAFKNLGSSLLVTGIDVFVQVVGTIAATAMLTMIFSRAILGRSSSIGEAWREARPSLLRLIGLTLLVAAGMALLFAVLIVPAALAGSVGLAVLGGLAALVLALWLGIKFSLASPALMLERSGVITSLRRSSKLVQGSWWRIFGITLLTGLITGFVSAIIVWPLTIVGLIAFGGGISGLEDGTASTAWGALILSGIGAIIAQTITMPIQSGVTVLLYVDQRIRREALDLELARAAGLENYGADATAPPTGG
ncbi:hypothetical protein ABZ924_33570 [Streptomyces sp. NPDC046876]|uniref:hypothetical protein n=1 Tax=Streptomyces sp. NPDC046876 TaxID=3155616 RepID=UPI0033FFB7F3